VSVVARISTVLGLVAVLGVVPMTPAAVPPGGGTAAAATVEDEGWARTRVVDRGPIRKCYREFCEALVWLRPGTGLEWNKFAINPEGNRWYFVRTSFGADGWMYCGNLSASC
jgi:hypothetical protein